MPGRFHGFLIIDKPAGWTSHDVVARVRRLLNEKRVGHAGTLDPAATGVLPVAVGQATKSIEWLEHARKSYLAEIEFGVATDSGDVDGLVIAHGDPGELNAPIVEAALQRFEGAIEQIPPLHSAIKIGGKKLYEHARRGIVIDVPARSVTVHRIVLLSWNAPVAMVFIECSKGTYIRSIARDLGEALGVPAYLSNLVRLASGPFDLSESWSLMEIAELDLIAEWASIAVHPDAAAHDLAAIIASDIEHGDWRQGRTISVDGFVPAGDVRVYAPSGDWIGMGRIEAGESVVRPVRVIADAA